MHFKVDVDRYVSVSVVVVNFDVVDVGDVVGSFDHLGD